MGCQRQRLLGVHHVIAIPRERLVAIKLHKVWMDILEILICKYRLKLWEKYNFFHIDQLVCTSTGQCSCLSNVEGKQCSSCVTGYYWNPSGLGCLPCSCDIDGSLSTVCSPTGQCSCQPNLGITGKRCDQCINGYYGYENGRYFIIYLLCLKMYMSLTLPFLLNLSFLEHLVRSYYYCVFSID